ncbi:hypothetical protein [Aquimarina pacifica]|uniref:hypothetical protein n=1 Tax=Aquimarina pacifica TaxID=1296415 RepID=UPI00047086BD|nr:hypothetical protein [Aquimarina pacifica]
MKKLISKLICVSILFLGITSCENETFEELNVVEGESSSMILPEADPNESSSNLSVISKSSGLPTTEYWEQNTGGETMFWRSGTYTQDGETTLTLNVSEWNLRNTQYNKTFTTWLRDSNYLFIRNNGINLALPIYSKETYKLAYIWDTVNSKWNPWRYLKYRAYTSTEYARIRSYSPNETIPQNWVRYSINTTGGSENVVGYLGLKLHRGMVGIHPTASVPPNWILYHSSSTQKLIRYLGVPRTGDTTTTRVGNASLPIGWRYIGSETTAIGIVLYTIEYTDPN